MHILVLVSQFERLFQLSAPLHQLSGSDTVVGKGKFIPRQYVLGKPCRLMMASV